MNLSCGNADLRAKAVAEAVGKAGGGVDVDAGGIHHAAEIVGGGFIFREDGVGVVGAEAIDVVHRLPDVLHDFDRHDHIQVLGPELVFAHDLHGVEGGRLSGASEAHAGFSQSPAGRRQEALRDGPVDEQRLCRVAGRRVLGLGIDDDREGLLYRDIPVGKNVADAVRVAHDRNLCVVHDIADEGVGTPGDQQVHVLVAL